VSLPPSELTGDPLVLEGAQFLLGEEQRLAQREARRMAPALIAGRKASHTGFERLDAAQAAHLASQTFPGLVDQPDGGPPRIGLGTRILRYSTRHSAQLLLANGRHVAVESAQPLAVEVGRGKLVPVDLGIRAAAGSFQPKLDDVSMRIPSHLASGVSLSALGLNLTPLGGGGSPVSGASGQIEGTTVFYGDTARDTDALVKPTSTGFEEDTVLRSVESPQRLAFRLGLPAGARASQTKGGTVSVKSGGRTIATIPAPNAYDAEGVEVPVTASLSKNVLTLMVHGKLADASGGYRYPIVVDPHVIDSRFYSEQANDNWTSANENPSAFKIFKQEITYAGAAYKAGQVAFFDYPTQKESHIYDLKSHYSTNDPRAIETMQFIKKGTLTLESPEQVLPAVEANGVAEVCAEGTCEAKAVTGNNKENEAIFEVRAVEEGTASFSSSFTPEVYIEQDKGPTASIDKTDATLEGHLNAGYTKWASTTSLSTAVLGVNSFDPGTGISSLGIKIVNSQGWGHSIEGSPAYECAGLQSGGVQCNECWESICAATGAHGKPLSIPFANLGELTEGEHNIEVSVADGVGIITNTQVTLKVDNVAPHNLVLSNLPAEMASGEFKLKGEATDASSGMRSLALFIDGKEVGASPAPCEPGSCTVNAEWTIAAREYAVGKHTAKMVATDNAGNVTSTESTFTVNPASSTPIGPGTVNLENGEFALNTTDVSMGGGLTVERSYGSRHPGSGTLGPFGAPWNLKIAGLETLTQQPNGSMVLITSVGQEAIFAKKGETFESPTGDANLKLTAVSGTTEFILSNEAAATSTTFKQPGFALPWYPTVKKGPTPAENVTYTFEAYGNIARPSQILAPVPANVSCSPELKAGCRALTFVYGTKTLAGEAESEWGEYTGDLKEVVFWAYNPTAKEMQKSAVAQYAYDKKGRLRAEWDPRITPELKKIYGYDSENRVVSITPPGQESWAFTYGTIAGDRNPGRLVKVMQAPVSVALWSGTNPANVEAPKVTGTPVVGVRLAVSRGSWSGTPIAYGYQWQDCNSSGGECSAIPGATNPNYVVASSDVGHKIVAQVRAINGGGQVSASSAATAIVKWVVSVSQLVDTGTAIDAVACVPATTDCVIGDSKSKAFYSTAVSATGSPNWFSWTGPATSPSDALACPTTGLCLMAAGKVEGEGGYLYYATSLGGTWTTASAPNFGYDSISCSSSSFCVAGEDKEGYFAYSTTPASSTSWVLEHQGTSSVKGVSCLSTSFCAMVDGVGNVRVGTTATVIKSSSWKVTDVNGTTALNGVACTSTTSCVAVDGAGNVLNLAINSEGVATATKHDIDGTNSLVAIACVSGTCVTIDSHGNIFVSTNSGETWTEKAQMGGVYDSVACASASLCVAVNATGEIMAFIPSGGVTEGESIAPEAGMAVEYGVPLSGTGLPTMTEGEVKKWGQTDLPTEAIAIFPQDKTQGWPASNYAGASLYYPDAKGQIVNAKTRTGGISTAEYNSNFNVVRTLGADNREVALKEGAKSAEVAKLLDTQSTYNAEGTELESTLGPRHLVKLSNGKEVQARARTVYSYNEGAPTEGGPYRLVTKVTQGAQVEGEAEQDVHTTTTSYSGQGNIGWKLREPTSVTTDPSGLHLTQTAVYEEGTGNLLESTTPMGAAENAAPSFAMQVGSAGAGNGQLKEPKGMAVDSKRNIWTADDANERIEGFTPTGEYFAQFGTTGTGNGQFKHPKGVAIDSKGNFWVADTENNRIQEFNEKREYVRQVGSAGTGNGQFSEPKGIAVDSHNNVWVTDTKNNRLEEFSETGVFIKAVGKSGTGNGELKEPRNAVVDSKGNIWVGDSNNNRIEEFNEAGEYVRKFGSEGSGNGQLKLPQGIGLDAKGNVWIADTNNNRVQEFSETGTYLAQFGVAGTGVGQMSEDRGLTIDSHGFIWVADTKNNRLEKWVPSAGGPHTTQTIYYSAAENATHTNCGKRPEWANLPCQTQPAVQPETAGLHPLPVTTYTYNTLDEPETVTSTVETETRTISNSYDAAGRITSSAVTSSSGTTLPAVSYKYEKNIGVLAEASDTVEGKVQSLKSEFDRHGQPTSYSEANGTTSSYEYETGGDYRLTSVNDGKGTQSFTYDENSGVVTSLKDTSVPGVFTLTATYDSEGNLLTESYPNGMTASYAYNQLGTTTGLEYEKKTHCTEKCVWFKDSIVPTIHGQWATQISSQATNRYTYDGVGRLTQVQDEPAGKGCTTRIYSYDEETNRVGLTTREPEVGGGCASSGGTFESHVYDQANRLLDAGTSYDTFGDTTKLPAVDAGGSLLESSFFVDGQLSSQTQAGETIGYSLDPGGRIRETVATGKTVATTLNHYDGAGAEPAWTSEPSGSSKREIHGLDGGLVATQFNTESPELQIANLHGDIVATASMSETASGLASTVAEASEYGVPGSEAPPKYSWLGAHELPTQLPSGVVTMGIRSYVPQLGRFLQTDPVPGGSANAYAYTFGDPLASTDLGGEYTARMAAGTLAAIKLRAAEASETRAAENAAQAEAERIASESGEGGEGEEWEEEGWEEEWEEEYVANKTEGNTLTLGLDEGLSWTPFTETEGAKGSGLANTEGSTAACVPSQSSPCARTVAEGNQPGSRCVQYGGHWVGRTCEFPKKRRRQSHHGRETCEPLGIPRKMCGVDNPNPNNATNRYNTPSGAGKAQDPNSTGGVRPPGEGDSCPRDENACHT
jgi:RHS repeat-associated protein